MQRWGGRLPISTIAVESVAEDRPASLTVAGAVPESRAVAHSPTSRFTHDATIAPRAPQERPEDYAHPGGSVNVGMTAWRNDQSLPSGTTVTNCRTAPSNPRDGAPTRGVAR